MLGGEQVQLVIKGIRQVGRVHFQGFVHEHIIVPAVRALAAPDDKLILILPEIQAADDTVQLIPPEHGFPDGAADFIHEVIFKMLHGCPGLVGCFLPVFFQMVAGQAGQEMGICLVILMVDREIPVGVTAQVVGPYGHQVLERSVPAF